MTYDQRWDKRSTTGTTNGAELVARQGHLTFLWSSRSLSLVICVLCFVHYFLSFRPFLAVILYVLQLTATDYHIGIFENVLYNKAKQQNV